MPRGDGTGPLGRGAIDGRGLGFCATAKGTRVAKNGLGLGVGLLGLGLGCRRGFGRNLIANSTVSKTQKELLVEEKELMETRLDVISKQLESL